jgi:hypothetical protein
MAIANCTNTPGGTLRDILMNATDNPFVKREEFTQRNLIAYKILTIVSWLLLVVFGALYTFQRPECSRHDRCHTIWGQNDHRPSGFSVNSVLTSVYWCLILILQAHYVRFLWSAEKEYVTNAANVGSHFILVCWHPPEVWARSSHCSRSTIS